MNTTLICLLLFLFVIYSIICYLQPKVAVYFSVFSIPFVKQFNLLNFKITLPALLFSLLFIVYFIKKIFILDRFKRTSLDLALLFLFISVLLSVVEVVNKFAFIAETLHLIQLISVYYLIVNIEWTLNEKKIVLISFLITMLLQSFYGIYQFFTRSSPQNIWWYEAGQFIVRASGTAYLQFSVFVSCAVVLALAFALYSKKKFELVLLLFSLIFYIFALIFSQVRGSWISCLFGVLTVTIIYLRKSKFSKKIFYIMTLFLFIFIVSILKFPYVKMRILSSLHNGTQSVNTIIIRFEYWSEAIRIFKKNPLTGVGFNNYSDHLDPKYKYMEGQDTYNIFFRFLAETGIIGFLSWCYFLIMLFVSCWKNLNNPVSVALAGIMVTIFFQSLYGTLIVGGIGDLFFLFAGLWVSKTNNE